MSKMMRAAPVVAPGRIELEDRPRPEPGEDEVLIRVRAVGICGSDKHYFSGKRAYEDSTVFPWVLGHEFAGEVAEVGPGVDRVEVGARVTCDPDVPCGSCRQCKAGLPNICPDVRFAGTPPRQGALSEYYLVRESQCHTIPDTMTFEEAVVHEPLAIGLHIINNLIRPEPEQTVAILGSGTIGLCCLVAARQQSTASIYVADPLANRLTVAEKYGATEVVDTSEAEFTDVIRARTGNGADVVIEATGDPAAMQQTTELAAPGAHILIEGIADQRMIPLDLLTARRRELTITVGRRSRHTAQGAIDLIARRVFDADAMITHSFPLEQTQRAMEITEALSDGVIKAIVKP